MGSLLSLDPKNVSNCGHGSDFHLSFSGEDQILCKEATGPDLAKKPLGQSAAGLRIECPDTT